LRILLVEDNQVLSEGLSALLRGSGYAVDVVSDGNSADAAIAAENFDLVITAACVLNLRPTQRNITFGAEDHRSFCICPGCPWLFPPYQSLGRIKQHPVRFTTLLVFGNFTTKRIRSGFINSGNFQRCAVGHCSVSIGASKDYWIVR